MKWYRRYSWKKLKGYDLFEISIPWDVFRFTLLMVIGDKKDVPRYIEQVHQDNGVKRVGEIGDADGLCWVKDDLIPIVWLPRFPKTSHDYGTAFHEILHAVFHLHFRNGLELTAESQEAFTHVAGWTVEQFMEACEEIKVELKKRGKNENSY